MPLKTPAFLVSSCGPSSIPALGVPGWNTSCRQSQSHSRTYAQHAQDAPNPASRPPQSQCDSADLAWPEAVHPHKAPTPYQILAARRGSAYTKQKFYALAKLYHPDQSCHASSPVAHLPPAERAERYRLVVAAHAILSDEAKRRAYDLWGSGWVGHHQNSPSADAPFEWRPEAKAWPSGHDPRFNATWEDWERWYQREYHGDTKTGSRDQYMNNFSFVTLIFALVSIGGIVQGTRANMMTSSVIEQRDKIHREASNELSRAQRATMSGDRSERIRTFLQHREATLSGGEAYQRLLPPPTETCSPDSIRKQ